MYTKGVASCSLFTLKLFLEFWNKTFELNGHCVLGIVLKEFGQIVKRLEFSFS